MAEQNEKKRMSEKEVFEAIFEGKTRQSILEEDPQCVKYFPVAVHKLYQQSLILEQSKKEIEGLIATLSRDKELSVEGEKQLEGYKKQFASLLLLPVTLEAWATISSIPINSLMKVGVKFFGSCLRRHNSNLKGEITFLGKIEKGVDQDFLRLFYCLEDKKKKRYYSVKLFFRDKWFKEFGIADDFLILLQTSISIGEENEITDLSLAKGFCGKAKFNTETKEVQVISDTKKKTV